MDSTTTIKSVPAFTEEQLNILKAAFAHVGVRLVERAYDGMRGWQHFMELRDLLRKADVLKECETDWSRINYGEDMYWEPHGLSDYFVVRRHWDDSYGERVAKGEDEDLVYAEFEKDLEEKHGIVSDTTIMRRILDGDLSAATRCVEKERERDMARQGEASDQEDKDGCPECGEEHFSEEEEDPAYEQEYSEEDAHANVRHKVFNLVDDWRDSGEHLPMENPSRLTMVVDVLVATKAGTKDEVTLTEVTGAAAVYTKAGDKMDPVTREDLSKQVMQCIEQGRYVPIDHVIKREPMENGGTCVKYLRRKVAR